MRDIAAFDCAETATGDDAWTVQRTCDGIADARGGTAVDYQIGTGGGYHAAVGGGGAEGCDWGCHERAMNVPSAREHGENSKDKSAAISDEDAASTPQNSRSKSTVY
ncbi:hypothetical protein NK8_01340 [Caballeronia sp. NK8]|nr:hypothetical protein NK8_01340 [Caballeronia sp. NK8]